MSRPNESKKEFIYAHCWRAGYEEIKSKTDLGFEHLTFCSNGLDYGYVKAWIAEQDDKIEQEKRITEALAIAKSDSDNARRSNLIAFVSAIGSIISAVIAALAVWQGL